MEEFQLMAVNTGRYFETLLPSKNESVDWRKRIGRKIYQRYTPSALCRILRQNRLQVDLAYLDKLFFLGMNAGLGTIFDFVEWLLFANKIKKTEIAGPPIFILGHWRNGTTFLHSLFDKDPSLNCPQAYQAIFPGCFLLSGIQKLVMKMEQVSPVKTRPMDNVKFGMYEPWEDEFVLAALSGISPYNRGLFPRTLGRERGYEYPGFQTSTEQKKWEKVFLTFLRRLTILENKRIVLKSPPHTVRIKLFLTLFPDAKFVHIIRNPYDVFLSTLKLWRDAVSIASLQEVGEEEIVEIILSTYEQMYERYHEEKKAVPPGNLIELTFEDLQTDPIGHMRRIYSYLQLPDFESCLPPLSAYLTEISGYKKNKFFESDEIKVLVRKRWASTFDMYGYK